MLRRSDLQKHINNFHPPSTLCHICGKNFESIPEFRYHRDYGHLEFMTCDLCGRYKTQSKVILWKHIQKHLYYRDESNRKFCCEICGYACNCKSRLDKHLLTHDVKKKSERFDPLASRRIYKCDKCEKGYVTPNDLRFHKKYKHEGHIREHKHFCEICGFKFYKRNKYQKHLLSMAHAKKALEAYVRKGN